MMDILSAEGREVLAGMVRAKVLLAFDYDGTLAPIVDDPATACMRRSTRDLLKRLAERLPCAVLSGRARRDPLLAFPGIALCAVVGNHGIEPWQRRRRYEAEVRRWRPVLEERLRALGGVRVEDKRFSLAFHFRAARDKRRALVTIRRAVAAMRDARVVAGKQVLNILPEQAPNKGDALLHLRAETGCQAALYVGDDVTDEDVFALAEPGLLGVRVGKKPSSLARYFIGGQREIDELLRVLLRATRLASGDGSLA